MSRKQNFIKRRFFSDDFKNNSQDLRDRFSRLGTHAISDNELLELLLSRASLKCDLKDLSHRLITEFGDFNRVLAASVTRLIQIKNMNNTMVQELKIVEASGHKMAQIRILNRDVLETWDELISYCQTVMAHRETEQFRILFLDQKNVLIADEQQQYGTVDHVPVYPREVAKRALELNASAVILVHNHPSGDPTPSSADIDMTHQIEQALRTLNIKLHDHLIIGKDDYASFHSLNLF